MIRCLITSAALKLLIEEPESDALARDLTSSVARGDRLVASLLLHTELHCAARRRAELDPVAIRTVLDRWHSWMSVGTTSGARPRPHGACAHAIHLATALRLEVVDIVA